MADAQHFARVLKKYRKERGLTQGELAEKLLVSAQSVSIWENGKGMPDLMHLCDLAKILSVSLDVLLDNRPDEVRCFIGIDGGGTKTEFVLIDETGRKLNSIILGGCNPNTCGIEAVVQTLCQGIDYFHPEEMRVCGVYLGGAGMGSGNNAQAVIAALEKAYPNLKFGCGNDIQNVIACCSEPDNCIAAISGTGCVVFSSVNGTIRRTGGAGYMFEGSGSGYDLGRDAIKAALQDRDETGPATMLTGLVEEKLGGGVWEHIHDLYKQDVSYIASFAVLVSQAAQQGDKVACEIMERSSEYAANLIRVALKKTPGIKNIIVSGSLYAKSDLFFGQVTEKLPKDLIIERLTWPPVWGACLQCAKLCQVEQLPSLQVFLNSNNEQ